MIRQLAVESLKRLFTSFCYFHKSVSHVDWCHEQMPGANTHVFSRIETVVIREVNNND